MKLNLITILAVLTIAVCISDCMAICSGSMVGDLDGDCIVDFRDVQELAEQWLTSGGSADLGGASVVNMVDFSLMAANWGASLPGMFAAETDSGTRVEEFGRNDLIVVSLSSAPSLDVTVTVSASTNDLELNGGFGGDDAVLVFEPDSWDVAQTITIAAAQDGVEEETETVTLMFDVQSGDLNYHGMTVEPITVSVIDELVKVCPRGDIEGDCRVTIADLAMLGNQWLDDTGCAGLGCADLSGLTIVNLEDLCVLLRQWQHVTGPVVINEFMAENDSDNPDDSPEPWEVFDEEGKSVDWIELKNLSNQPERLDGWYLTDDTGDLTKWEFPSNTIIPANGYLLIYASGKDLVAGSFIHTNFSLDADGEFLALVGPDQEIVSVFDEYEYKSGKFGYVPQVSNVSYGLINYLKDRRYFSPATPGRENLNSALGLSPDVQFTRDRGFYSTPFDVTLSVDDPDATIRYTTDGSEPDWTHGQTLASGSAIHIDGTTVLRARSYLTGALAGAVETQTYLFINDVVNQQPDGSKPGPGWPEPGTSTNGQKMNYGMDPDVVNSEAYGSLMDDALLAVPTLSLVTDLENLFDPETGIYVNAWDARSDTDFWTLHKEKPCSLELLNPDGEDGFHINCGLRIRGGWSRNDSNPKHAFRVFFRSKYGADKLKYPLFEDEGVDEFDKIDLRTSQNYAWARGSSNGFHNTMLREVFSRDMQGKLGHPYTKSRYYHLYVNGIYWGLFQTQERAEARFAASYMGGSKADYDCVKPDWLTGRTMIATDGNLDAFHRLWTAFSDGVGTAEEYFRLQGMNTDGTPNPAYERLLDVDNVIDFQIINYYTADTDGAGSRFGNKPNNIFGYYNRANPDGFKWSEHDSEHSLGISGKGWPNYENLVTPFTTAGAQFKYFNPHWMHEQLAMQNDEYCLRFADRVQELFFNDDLFTPDNVWSMLMNRKAQIEVAIIAESARWGDTQIHPPRTRDNWYDAQQFMQDFIYGTHSSLGVDQPWDAIPRELRVLQQLKDAGFFPDITVPKFQIDGIDQHGGSIAANSQLSIIDSVSGGGGSYVDQVIVPEVTPVRVHVPTDNSLGLTWITEVYVPDASWTNGSTSTGVGYEVNIGYENWINTNVQPEVHTKETSVFCRIEFDYDGADAYQQLQLWMRYDDGFIAYLNGTEVCRSANITNETPGSAASNNHEASGFELFDISANLPLLEIGTNVLAIHGINTSLTSSDMLIQPKLVGRYWQPEDTARVMYTTDGSDPRKVGGMINVPSAQEYVNPIPLTKSTRVKARKLVNSQWSAVCNAAFEIGNVKDKLRITEIMYHPADPNTEYIELQNISGDTINLSLVELTDGIQFIFGDVDVSPGQHVLIVQDAAAFEAKYGSGLPVAGQYTGRLSNGGETIQLSDAVRRVIQIFKYKDGWYDITDGQGFSLTIRDPLAIDLSVWDSKDGWRASAAVDGSPGVDDSGQVPDVGSIVINEILAHSHAALPDWIELYNTTDAPINIGGWFLSDNDDDDPNRTKYEIPAGTVVPANGYAFFTENHHFGNPTAPGCNIPFALSEGGETVYLRSGQGGVVTGYSEQQSFGASATHVALGRYYKASVDDYDFVAMSQITPGASNALPKVGPIVISEIMYNPADGGSFDNDEYEFIELRNISDSTVTLQEYDALYGIDVPWKLTDGVDYTFDLGVTITAGERIVVVKNKMAFSSRYPSVPAGKIFGPYKGNLDNGGEKIEISMPGDEEDGERYYIRVDRINYDDELPWPQTPDNGGDTLDRIDDNAYGNDAANWQATAASP